MIGTAINAVKAFLAPQQTRLLVSVGLLFFVSSGWIYEIAYFSRLGIEIPKGASWIHYAVSGSKPIILLFLAVVVLDVFRYILLGNHEKFRSDFDLEKHRCDISEMDLKKAFTWMRIGFGFSACCLILAITSLPLGGDAGGAYLYFAFVALITHFPLIVKQEGKLKSWAVMSLAISLMMCNAANGVGVADRSVSSSGVIRDDTFIVTKGDLEILARPGPVDLPVIGLIKKVWSLDE